MLSKQKGKQKGISMTPCEITVSITALANSLSSALSVDELNLLGVDLRQLDDTIITIATAKTVCKTHTEE